MSATPLSRFGYRAFISYSHQDKVWADWLHKALETWRAPARLVGAKAAHGAVPPRLTPIFRDRAELASATDLSREIETALAQSECLIVICSPAAAASPWVNAEVLAFKRGEHGARVLCLIVDGEPHATDGSRPASEECFCPALRFKLDADGQPTSTRTEPVAADVRSGHDSKTDAKLKLIAGILGLGFDALKQREQHRRVQRMALITGIALVVMALTSTLAVSALISRHAALTAQQAAERRQKQAEGLVGFMLGDLYDQLDAMQRLDIMQRVTDRSLAYFAALPPGDMSATTLAQRAKALEQIGVIRMAAGNLAGALAAFDASSQVSARLAAANPDDAARQVAWSRTLAFIGMVHWKQSRLADAQRNFERSRPALQKLAARPGAATAVLFQLALLDNNLGHVLEVRGEQAAAAAHYRERLELAQRLAAIAHSDNDYVADLGDAHGNMGRLALQRGDLLAAVAEHHAADRIATRLWEADRNNNIRRQTALEAHAILGRTLALAGATERGTELVQQAVDTATQLVKFEPGNTDFRVDLALYSTQLAQLRRLAGDSTQARTLVTHAAGILRALASQDPANTEWRKYAAQTMLEQAAQAAADGQRALAHEHAQAALDRLQPLRAARPGDHDVLLLTATAQLQAALAQATPNFMRAELHALLRVLDELSPTTTDPRLLALAVEARLALGDKATAQSLLTRLWQVGYRDDALLATLARARMTYLPPDFPPPPTTHTRSMATPAKSPN